MSKNKKADFVKDLLDVLSNEDKSLDELLKGTPSKDDSTKNLKKAADIVNKGLEKESPFIAGGSLKMKKTEKKKVEVGLEGFISPEEARAETNAHSIRLINVNKTVNSMLELVEREIVNAATNGDSTVTIDFFDGEYGEMLYAVRLETVLKVINRLTNYIDSLGYDVELDTWEEDSEEDEYDFDLYAHLTISW